MPKYINIHHHPWTKMPKVPVYPKPLAGPDIQQGRHHFIIAVACCKWLHGVSMHLKQKKFQPYFSQREQTYVFVRRNDKAKICNISFGLCDTVSVLPVNFSTLEFCSIYSNMKVGAKRIIKQWTICIID
jgi:hypothetical protein